MLYLFTYMQHPNRITIYVSWKGVVNAIKSIFRGVYWLVKFSNWRWWKSWNFHFQISPEAGNSVSVD